MSLNTDFTNNSNIGLLNKNLGEGISGDTSNTIAITNPFEEDGIAPYEINPLTFDGVSGKTYNASASNPTLSSPNTNIPSGANPYGPDAQGLIVDIYAQNVTTQIQALGLSKDVAAKLFDYLINPNSTVQLTPDEQALVKTINSQATQATIKASNLPNTWTLHAQDPESWTPLPIAPYDADKQVEIKNYYQNQLSLGVNTYIEDANPPLTDQEKSDLQSALASELQGNPQVPASIADIYAKIQQIAIQGTQTQYFLPNTWSPDTPSTDVQSWSPVNQFAVNPTAIANAKVQNTLTNADQIVNEIQNAINAKIASLPPNDPNRASLQGLSDYLKAISTAIAQLKRDIQQIEIQDAAKEREDTKAKFSALADQRAFNDAQFQKALDAQEKQKTQSQLSLAFKIIGPIIAAIGVIVSVLTLGIASPLGVALLTLGLALVAFSVVDSVMDLTSKLGQALSNWLNSVTPKDLPDWQQKLIKAAIIIAIAGPAIVALAVLIATGSGEGLAANIALQAVRQTVQQIAVQAILLIVLSSNVIPDLAASILEASGVGSDGQLAGRIISQVLILLLVLLAVAAGQPGGLAAFFKNAAGGIGEAASGTVRGVKAGAAQIKESIQSFIELLQNADSVADFAGEVANSIRNTAKEVLALLTSIKNVSPQQDFKDFLETIQDLSFQDKIKAWARAAKPFISSTEYAVGIAGGLVQGVIALQLSRIYHDVGDIQSQIEILRAIIKLLEKVLQNIQKGLANYQDFAQSLQDFINGFISALKQLGTKEANSIIPQQSA